MMLCLKMKSKTAALDLEDFLKGFAVKEWDEPRSGLFISRSDNLAVSFHVDLFFT